MYCFIRIVLSFFVVMAAGNAWADFVVPGHLVDISIEVNNKPAAGRFFKPNNFQADVWGDNDSSSYHYRYLEAVPGDEYGIAVKVKIPTRYMVGICVDGFDILKGQKMPSWVHLASAWPSAYVVGWPNITDQGNTIYGWRESAENVRKFVFSEVNASMAAKWNDLSASGTIVIAVFREKEAEMVVKSPPTGMKGKGGRGLGTAAGDSMVSRATTVDFESRDLAYEVFIIKYEKKKKLQELGAWKPIEQPASGNRFWPGSSEEYINFGQ